jgi:hypothetical protein
VIDDAHLVGFGVTGPKADLGFFGKFHKTILTRAGAAEGAGGAGHAVQNVDSLCR